MGKKKRERMKAKERRHTTARPPTSSRASQDTPAGARKPAPRPTGKGKKRQPRRWLGLSGRQWLWVGVAVIVLAAAAVLAVWWFGQRPTAAPTPAATEIAERPLAALPPAERVNYYSSPPAMQIDRSKQYLATIHTEKGDIVVELYADKAPNTVNNFVFLANQGYYDDTTFHRVIPGFMAQAGDPSGTGKGGPGYRFEDEFHPDLRHDGPGVLSMANAGPNTNGSQFFITYAAQPHLDDAHTVFGKVIEGLDVLEQITPRDPDTATAPGDRITSITIEER